MRTSFPTNFRLYNSLRSLVASGQQSTVIWWPFGPLVNNILEMSQNNSDDGQSIGASADQPSNVILVRRLKTVVGVFFNDERTKIPVTKLIIKTEFDTTKSCKKLKQNTTNPLKVDFKIPNVYKSRKTSST
uniref:Uncharacterized protein n=1 Tax=Romanomermis culicivorax TaxID=13658 RepID=A0A915HIE1_ROMCU